MASPLQRARQPVVVFAPGRGGVPAARPRVGPAREPFRAVPRIVPTGRSGELRDAARPWAGFAERVTSTKAAQEARQQQAEEAAAAAAPEQGGFWGSDFGKGLGFVINNPVTRAAMQPLNYFQMLGRANVLGLEEAAEAVQGSDLLKGTIGRVPQIRQLLENIDTDRTAADERSNVEKVFAPNTTYGFGEITPESDNPWLNRLVGFTGDVITDPLSFTGGGATRLIQGASHVDEASRALTRATRALELAEEAGDAKKIEQATRAVSMAEDYATRAPTMPRQDIRMPLPPNRKGRADFIGELQGTPEGQAFIENFPTDVRVGGLRGLQHMSPEAKAALRIEEPGLRIRGLDTRIPGTGTISRGLNWAGGNVRAGMAQLPGANSKLGNIFVPKGLEEAFNTLTRGAEGDVGKASTEVFSRNLYRQGAGAQTTRGGRTITRALRKELKQHGEEGIRQLVTEAETSPKRNLINDIAARLLKVYESVTGRVLDKNYLRDPDTYLPHVLAPRWRRAVAKMSKSDNKAAQDFLHHTGTKQDELLENAAFYLDNTMEGSGFLEKARKLGTDKNGNPQTFKFGDTEVTFEADDIGHINEKLREAFPMWKGDFYDTDPARIFEAYNSSLARQAGRDVALNKLVETGNKYVTTLTGDLEATRQALDAALSQQGASPLLNTAQGRYDPTQPLPTVAKAPTVPGSAADRAARANLAGVGAPAAARSPEEAAAAAALIEGGPLPAEQFGGINPEDYFRTTEGSEATKARDAAAKRAGTYARAAAAEAKEAEAAVRKGVEQVREQLVNPLRTSIRDMKAEITKINKRIREWAKTIKDLGPLTSNNEDDLLLLTSKVDDEIANIEAKLRRTSGQWKGRATRAQRKAEQNLRESLDNLKRVRDQAAEQIKRSSENMQTEFANRKAALDKPVRDAQIRQLTKEADYHSRNPVPHNQADVDEARRVMQASAGTPEMHGMDVQRERYRDYLKQIDEINQRRGPNGGLSRADQRAMDKVVGQTERLRDVLRRRMQRAGAVSPFEEAQTKLRQLDEMIPNAPRNQVKGLTRQRDRLAKEFQPGGRFAEEVRARQILADTAKWEEGRKAFMKDADAALEQAQNQRLMRQEAIIWTSASRQTRHLPPPGAPPNTLEQMGWGVGETRIPEPIKSPPQREAWVAEERPMPRPGEPEPRPRPVPPPRTEEEALASLGSQLEYGSPTQQAGRMKAWEAEQKFQEAARRAPHEIVETKGDIVAEMAKGAAEENAPNVARLEVHKNLQADLADKNRIITKRNQTRVLRDRLNAANPTTRKLDLGRTIDEIEDVARANPDLADDKLTQVESILNSHRQELIRVKGARMRVQDLDRVVQDAKDGNLAKVMIATLNNNWRAMHTGPLNAGDIIMDAELHKRFMNLWELNKQPQLLGRTFNAFTNLFKTYATLSPGFFVRNTIGGIFMNSADGVTLGAQREGAELWQKFIHRNTADTWFDEQPQRIQDALLAAMGSGAGGRFEDLGVLAKTNSRAYNMISNNPATRWGQRMGNRVEGAMRLGMALDSIDKGYSVSEAMNRIGRVHFDYGQVSQLDETMKRIIPFWTFMSRNLPLQIQEMWTNPRVYSYYMNLVKNFSEPDEQFTPDYWTRQGAWKTPLSIGGNAIYAQPDLGFTRVQSDLQLMSDALSGKNFGAALANVNPGIGATMDFINKRDSFYNRSFDENRDYTKQSGPVGIPLTLLAGALGQTNEAGQVSDNFTNYMTSLIPPLAQVQRLLPEASGADTTADTWAKRARYLGIPAQLLTPKAQQSEFWRQRREIQDAYARQLAMLEEAAS
jgi:hypothetical protein